MARTHIGQPLSVDCLPHRVLPPAQQRAADAIAKARRLWPGVHADVLAQEIFTGWTHLHWLGPNAKTQQLIDEILATPEVQ